MSAACEEINVLRTTISSVEAEVTVLRQYNESYEKHIATNQPELNMLRAKEAAHQASMISLRAQLLRETWVYALPLYFHSCSHTALLLLLARRTGAPGAPQQGSAGIAINAKLRKEIMTLKVALDARARQSTAGAPPADPDPPRVCIGFLVEEKREKGEV